jgi:UrcA family protein
MTRTFTFAAIMTALVVSAPAHAAWNETGRMQQVQIADLNLASFEGRKRLETRIKRAARTVCGVGEDRSLSSAAAANTCYKKAMTDVQAQLAAALRANGQSAMAVDAQ